MSQERIAWLDAWAELNQGGRLLNRAALEKLPQPAAVRVDLADQLRDALTATIPVRDKATADLSALLDVVLEAVCGHEDGWRKGPAVGKADTELLLDGTELKPRRVLTLAGEVVLAVFAFPVERLGVHKGRRSVAQALEYLRRRKISLGLVTNGREWRLLFGDPDNTAWVEWSADRFLDAETLSPTLHLLRLVLSPASLRPPKAGDPSPLLNAIRETRRGQAALSKELGENVRKAVEHLLRARLPLLSPSWGERDSKDTYQAACHFVMRLVVVLFAESRELLPVDNSIYHQAYGLRSLQDSLERAGAVRRRARTSAWPRLLGLFRLLHAGSHHPQVAVPAYGGDLFRAGSVDGDPIARALALLESPSEPPADEIIYQLLRLLTRTTERVRDGATVRTVAVPVDFTELTSEYIGILYEGLLDYELKRVDKEPILFLGLGDQPALPLNRLEEMGDKQLGALVEKAKVGRKTETDEEEGDDEESNLSDEADVDEEATPGSVEAEAEPDESFVDDTLRQARERAERWAVRAAIAGKLIRAPRGKKGKDDLAWQAEASKVAKSLIVDLKLPGELYLVRWGGTRKGAGTFYTRPQLTIPTVRRMVEALSHDADGKVRTPEEILALKVCDPAMGSGSFLVAALRVLTEAVVTSLHVHGRIKKNNGRVQLECEPLPNDDRDQTEERIPAIVRRAVVEHCLYGVDLDKLAVELARVSLWVETLDRDLPFTFLDHKLRCGDALVGTWLDRFRDYPLLAWWRQSPDEKWRGVTHEGDIWARKLKDLRTAVVEEQRQLIVGQTNLDFAGASDDELRAALVRVRELYRRLRAVPATQPDKRAEIWRKQVATDPALLRVRQAFDTWCSLWFWPLDKLEEAPRPAEFSTPSGSAQQIVKTICEQQRFFHWELEFPDVFTESGSGFDAVVGNPPWETKKPKSQEFFANYDPLFRGYSKQEALTRQRELFLADPAIEQTWLDYVGRFKDAGNFVRNAATPFGDAIDDKGRNQIALVTRNTTESLRLHQRWNAQRVRRSGYADVEHPFRHQGSADLNTYKLFSEAAYRLVRPNGIVGLIVPAALLSDHGSRDLRELLVYRSDTQLVYVFQNERKVFKDVHHASKQMILIARRIDDEAPRSSRVLPLIFRLGVGDSPEADEVQSDFQGARTPLRVPVATLAKFSPKSLSVLEIRSMRDLEVLSKIYENSVLLGEDGPAGWGIQYAREFDMTNDSKLFVPRDKAEEAGYKADEYGRWIGQDGEVLLPLYEGRMIGQFDFSKKGWVSGKGRTAVWRDIPWEKKVIEPQFVIRRSTFADERPSTAQRSRVAFMDVTAATNTRTMVAVAIPPLPCGNSAPILTTSDSPVSLAAILNSYIYDFVARARCGGLHLNYFVIEETPLIPPDQASVLLPIASTLSASPILAPLLMEGSTGQREYQALTKHERLRQRCILDTIIATLYGLGREDLHFILRHCDQPRMRLADAGFRRTLDPKGFWKVDDGDEPELRQAVLTMVAFDALAKTIAEHGGDSKAGIAAFCSLNNGNGWMVPDTLCLADYGLGHDERAEQAQPVASRLGQRLLDWQMTQTPEDRWAECEHHARAILGDAEFELRFGKKADSDSKSTATPAAVSPAPPLAAAASVKPSVPQLGLFEPKPAATTAATEPLTMSISSIRLLNFRNWTDAHWEKGIALKPITLVLGRNSAGKTSILQPLRMLKQTMEATDAGTYLLLDGTKQDGVNLGAYSDVVNGHDEKREMGVGIDLPESGVSVDVRFKQVEKRPVIDSLVYRIKGERVEVTRGPNAAYQLSSPRFRLPNWDGSNTVHVPKKEVYDPGRAIEFSEQALKDLGSLGETVRGAMVALKKGFEAFHFLGPLRPPPAREVTWSQQDPTRLSSNGSETVQALLSNETGRNKGTLKQAVSYWLQRLDLADAIEVSQVGRTRLYQIEVIRKGNRSNIVDVGFGVSQILPVVVLLHFVPEGSVILCEDPDAHLHPMAQTRLADLFVEVARKRRLQVLVETHSEHMFRRLQTLMADGALPHQDCALYYVERDEPSAKITELLTDDYGRVANWPRHLFGDAAGETGRQLRSMVTRMKDRDGGE